jgi:hypothetical protein
MWALPGTCWSSHFSPGPECPYSRKATHTAKINTLGNKSSKSRKSPQTERKIIIADFWALTTHCWPEYPSYIRERCSHTIWVTYLLSVLKDNTFSLHQEIDVSILLTGVFWNTESIRVKERPWTCVRRAGWQSTKCWRHMLCHNCRRNLEKMSNCVTIIIGK